MWQVRRWICGGLLFLGYFSTHASFEFSSAYFSHYQSYSSPQRLSTFSHYYRFNADYYGQDWQATLHIMPWFTFGHGSRSTHFADWFEPKLPLISRAQVILDNERMLITLGRQPISFGRGFIWQIWDVFNSGQSLGFFTPYSSGTDALRLDYYFNDFSGLSMVWSPGDQHKALVKLYDESMNFTPSLYVGHENKALLLGFSLSQEVGQWIFNGDFQWCKKLIYSVHEYKNPNHTNVLINFQRLFNDRSSFTMEYFSNRSILWDTRDRPAVLQADLVPDLEPNLFAIKLDYQATPLLSSQVMIQAPSSGSSAQFAVSFRYELSQNVYMLLQGWYPLLPTKTNTPTRSMQTKAFMVAFEWWL